jgi:RNA polymerase sigma-70 factor (TIGR02952 family)
VLPGGTVARGREAAAAAGLSSGGRVLVENLRVLLALVDGTDGSQRDGFATGSGPAGGPAGAPTRPLLWGPHRGAQRPPEEMTRVAALVELAQRGDGEAFGQLYDSYVEVVYRYIYVRVGSQHLAEDLTSETFVRALRAIGSFRWQGRDIAAWFITIARNLITDNAKSARFRMEVTTADMLDADEHVAAPEEEVLQRMRDGRLLAAVRGLKPEQAECVVLRFLQGLSVAETAEVLGKSEGAVKQLQLRAVRALHKELAGVDI